MTRWIVYKLENKESIYLSGVTSNGKPIHTYEESKACKFNNVVSAMCWLDCGYCLMKE